MQSDEWGPALAASNGRSQTLVSASLSSFPQSCVTLVRMFLEPNPVKSRSSHIVSKPCNKGREARVLIFFNAITYFKVRCAFFFFSPRFFHGGRLSQPRLCVFVLLFVWLWVCFVLFFPHWLLEIVFVYAEVYLGKLLWSYRSAVRILLRTWERNIFKMFRFWPVLLLHFQFVFIYVYICQWDFCRLASFIERWMLSYPFSLSVRSHKVCC